MSETVSSSVFEYVLSPLLSFIVILVFFSPFLSCLVKIQGELGIYPLYLLGFINIKVGCKFIL